MDSILNEMIKHGRYFLLPSLEKIFNDILNSCKFPTNWNTGVIIPFTKKKVIEGPQQITEESLDKLSGQIVHINFTIQVE